jgi:hypothetical protein
LGLTILVVAILLVAILYAIADTTGFDSKGFDASARGMLWAWGILFLAMQTLLHWFVSQGILVVEVSAFNEDETLNTG